MIFRPVRLLALLALLLAAGLAWQWVDEHAHLRNLVWVAPKALPPDIKVPVIAPQSANTGDAAQFAAILERPIFAPDRRPPPPPAPPPPPDPMANIQLSGIFSGESGGILARVDGKMRRIKVNESVGAWTLKSIDGRDVTFAQGTETRQLHLSYAPLGVVAQKTAEATGAAPAQGAGVAPPNAFKAAPNIQDEARGYQRRRNEARAARGLPPIPE